MPFHVKGGISLGCDHMVNNSHVSRKTSSGFCRVLNYFVRGMQPGLISFEHVQNVGVTMFFLK